MSQFARPSSNILVGAWLAVGAPTIWEAIDDVAPGDDLTTYVQTTVGLSSSDEFEVGLSSVTDPGTSTGHILRIRHFEIQNGGLPAAIYQVTLLQGATTIASRNLTDFGGSWTTEAFTLTAAEADAITDYSALRVDVFVEGDASDAVGFVANVTWAELEVPNVAAPTVVGPRDQSVILGTAATFSVEATGTGTLSYQWQKKEFGGSFADIGGATSSSYIISPSANTDMRDQYRCNVTDTIGTTTSRAATLYVRFYDVILWAQPELPIDSVVLHDPTLASTTPAKTTNVTGSVGITGSIIGIKQAIASEVGAIGVQAQDVGKKSVGSSAVGAVGAGASETAKKGALSSDVSAVGLAAQSAAKKNALSTQTAAVGVAALTTGAEGDLYSAVGRVGVAGSESSQKNALTSIVAAVGLGGSETGTQARSATTTSSDAVGISASTTFARSAIATAVGAIGLSAAELSIPQRLTSSTSRLGLSASTSGTASFESHATTVAGVLGTSGSTTGVAGAARLEGSGGPRRRHRGARPDPEQEPLRFGPEHKTTIKGAVGLSGSTSGRGAIQIQITIPGEITTAPGFIDDVIRTLNEVIPPTPRERVKERDFSFPIVPQPVEAVGFAHSTAFGVTGSTTGKAFIPAAPSEEPVAPPPPVAPPQPVVAAGSVKGVVGISCSAAGLRIEIPAADEELDMIMAIAAAMMLDEEEVV